MCMQSQMHKQMLKKMQSENTNKAKKQHECTEAYVQWLCIRECNVGRLLDIQKKTKKVGENKSKTLKKSKHNQLRIK